MLGRHFEIRVLRSLLVSRVGRIRWFLEMRSISVQKGTVIDVGLVLRIELEF